MRLTLLSLIVILSSLLNAQDFALPSSVWNYTNNGGEAAPNTYLWQIDHAGDTVLGGQNARVFLNSSNSGGYGLEPVYYFLMRNDSVFAFNAGQWHLLYDFSAQAGDTLDIINMYTATIQYFKFLVDSVVPVQYGTVTLNRYFLHTIDSSNGIFYGGYYTQRLGADMFYPFDGVIIPEHAVLRCYADSSMEIHVNYPGSDCDQGNPYGIDETQSLDVAVYPNPSYGEIFIESEKPMTGPVNLYSADGSLIFSKYVNQENLFELHLPPYLTDGIYYLHFNTDQGQLSKKLILIR